MQLILETWRYCPKVTITWVWTVQNFLSCCVRIRHNVCINSSPPSAAYMRQWTGSALVQVMACRLFGAWLIGPICTNFNEVGIKIQNFSFMKMHLKMLSAKLQPFCPRGDELMYNFLPYCARKCGSATFPGFPYGLYFLEKSDYGYVGHGKVINFLKLKQIVLEKS